MIAAITEEYRRPVTAVQYQSVKLLLIHGGATIISDIRAEVGEAVVLRSNALASGTPDERVTISAVYGESEYLFRHWYGACGRTCQTPKRVKFREYVPTLPPIAKSLVSGLSAGASVVEQGPRSIASEPVPGTRQAQRRLDAASTDALVDGYLNGQTVYEPAAEFGIERRTVSAHLHQRGVTMRGAACHSRRKRKRSRSEIAAGRWLRSEHGSMSRPGRCGITGRPGDEPLKTNERLRTSAALLGFGESVALAAGRSALW